VREYAAFISSFDSADDDDWDGYEDRFAVPEWVAYEIKRFQTHPDGTYKKPQGASQRPSKWYKSRDLDFLFDDPTLTSKRLDDSYRGIGRVYNRGHLARKLHADRISWRAGCNTHHLSNAVPQAAGFNQGIWLDMENYTGAWANKFGRVWIITGPIFYRDAPRYVIGDAGEVPVAIPDALFKIVIKENTATSLPDVLAFIYPQWNVQYYKTGNCRGDKTYSHTPFLVSVDQIEQATGLSFFTAMNWTDEQQRTVKTQVATSLWPVEAKYFGDSCN
jgi:DNA/RNA endonuclease G (NUC1)